VPAPEQDVLVCNASLLCEADSGRICLHRVDVTRAAYAMCGTAGIFTDHPLAQARQDALVVPQHTFLSEGTWQSAGQMLMGLEATPGFP
jgi:hypothetical protein